MMYMGRTLRELSGPVLPARFDPVIRVLVRRWIVHAGKVEGLTPLDAGPAATAMKSAALVARPGFDESRAAVGIYEMVATVHRGRYRVGPFRRGDAEGDGEHDGVAVGHHGDAHGLLGIVPLRDRAAAGQ